MMTYVFEDLRTGEEVELEYPAGTAPGIGAEIEHSGRRLMRVASFTLATEQIARTTHGYPYKAPQMDSSVHGCDKDRDGTPIITSQRQERGLRDEHGQRLVRKDMSEFPGSKAIRDGSAWKK